MAPATLQVPVPHGKEVMEAARMTLGLKYERFLFNANAVALTKGAQKKPGSHKSN
jgi:hypothetical protein